MLKYVVSGFENLCIIIDKMIVALNGYLFELFLGLTNIQFRNTYIFDKLANRLYVLIGIFMVFRVTFSLIQMLANPDMMSDKEKGIGKLATRVVIALSLLVLTPFIFEKAMELQSVVLEENIIGQVVLGVNTNNTASVKSQGKNLAFQVFKGFVSPNEDVSSTEKNDEKSNYNICKARYEDENIDNIHDLIHPYPNNPGKLNCITDYDSNGESPYTYLFLVSTVGSLVLAWMVVGFCIDVATRLIKLGFYQIIAPIPIITYINGDKNGPFNTWVKKCISTYISVFIKLLIIYFIIYMCSIITRSGIDFNAAFGSNPSLGIISLAKVAVILGLIVFAKIAPNLIKNMFGIKDDEESGGFVKSLAKAALLGGAGMMAAGASNAAFGLNNAIGEWKKGNVGKGFANFGKGFLSTAGGMASGLRHGAMNGYANKGANPFSGLGKTVLQSNQARYNRSKMWAATEGQGNVFQRAAKSFGGTMYDIALGRTGIDTKIGNNEKTLKNKLAGIQSARSANSQARYSMINNGTISADDAQELNRFTFDAFANKWYETEIAADGKVKIIDHGAQSVTDIAALAGVTGADAENYLEYVKQDASYNRAEVELNKQLGVVGQIKEKREGKLDR